VRRKNPESVTNLDSFSIAYNHFAIKQRPRKWLYATAKNNIPLDQQ
jgi:hypothetical protein